MSRGGREKGKKTQAQTERSVHTGRARKREREAGRDERKRLHLLDAPALGSLPTSVSREESE